MNTDILNEYDWLKDHCLFSIIDRNAVSDHTLTKFIWNVRSLAKHFNGIVHGCMCLKNAAIEFKENQMKPSDFTSIMDDTLHMNFKHELTWMLIAILIIF